MGTLSSPPASRRMWNTQLARDCSQFQIVSVAMSLIIYGAHMNVLFIIKVKLPELINSSYRSPQLCWLWSLEWLANVEYWVQSHLYTCFIVFVLSSKPNHTTLKYRFLIKKSNRVRFAHLNICLGSGPDFSSKFWIQTLFLSPSKWREWNGPWMLLLTCISPFSESNLVSISFYYLVLGPPCPSAYINHPWGYPHLVLLLGAHKFQWELGSRDRLSLWWINLS